jgi:hypothetical protein
MLCERRMGMIDGAVVALRGDAIGQLSDLFPANTYNPEQRNSTRH